MEKKRWVLILMALCLSLAFSVSSVEAQRVCDPVINESDRCDRDGDCYVKNNRSCRNLNEDALLDCNDNNGDLTDNCDESSGGGKVEICHTNSPANPPAFTGTTRFVTEKALEKHLAHGDCVDFDDETLGEFQCTCNEPE